MTEIQIKNLIKEYEKEYIEFMEIEKLPQYKIDFFEINVEESDAAGFASAAQAYGNVCKARFLEIYGFVWLYRISCSTS